MRKIANITIIILSFLIFQTNLKAAEFGSKHTYGLIVLGSYEYEESKFMTLKAGAQAESDELSNIGFLYNYKKAFLTKNNYLTELELDSSIQFFTQTYWSNGSGTMEDIDVEVYNLRALYGVQISEKLMIKSGLGYRYLFHHWKDRTTSTGGSGYDREQDYTYIPIKAELKAPIPELNINGKLTVEYDHIIEGNNTSHGSQTGSTDNEYVNNNGYMWKISYETKHWGFNFEPYYELHSVEKSKVIAITGGTSWEPANTTKEFGLKVKKEFNSNRSEASAYKNVQNSNEYYFGYKLLLSQVENGMSSPSGDVKLEEEGVNFSLVSGRRIFDTIKGLPIKLDIEIAFNQFGDSYMSANNSSDSIVFDGRYRNGLYSAGSRVSMGGADIDITIESRSTSIGIKPSYEILNNLFINANLGLHRWEQQELTYWPGSGSSMTAQPYKGTDLYYGIGLDFKIKTLSFEIEYVEHDMYYDANSFAATLKYNF